VLLHNMYI